MNVYIAAPFSWKDEINDYATELRSLGINVTSSWLEEKADPKCTLDQFQDSYHEEIAAVDVRDIDAAQVVAVFTIDPLGPPKPRGGRHWETGYAYGRNKEVIVIGPKENIFHYLSDVKTFGTKEEAKKYLYQRSLN